MKNFKYALFMFMALAVSVSCSDDGDDDTSGDPLVGSWIISETEGDFEISIRATFNENSSGTLVTTVSLGGESESETTPFTWSTSGDQLTLNIEGESEVTTYSISGNKLTLTDDDGSVTVLERD